MHIGLTGQYDRDYSNRQFYPATGQTTKSWEINVSIFNHRDPLRKIRTYDVSLYAYFVFVFV